MEELEITTRNELYQAKKILYEGDDKTKRTFITLLITFVFILINFFLIDIDEFMCFINNKPLRNNR